MTEVRRFACTICGKCCNRSPEIELSEAAALADVFVFRLMFRMYSLPRLPDRGQPSKLFYQKKRLLAAHVARTSTKKAMRGGKLVEVTNYLMISALALDTKPGACSALIDNLCTIHGRRPLTCRTVPFHYSRPDALALLDFDAFVATPDYRCDTSGAAPVVLQDDKIVDSETLKERVDALAVADRDRPWKEAIVRRMKTGDDALPSMLDIEANAGIAAMTTSMRIAWEVAADTGLLSRDSYRTLIDQQVATIERELVHCKRDRETLGEMRAEYRRAFAAIR